MLVYQTNKLINELEQQTESFLQIVTKWQVISPKKLLTQPIEGKWSAAQCLAHLNSYGHYYLPAIEKAIEVAKSNSWEAKAEFKAGWLGNYFTNLMKPETDGRKMKKMSTPKAHSPVVNLNSDEVLSEFINQQEKLLLLLETAKKVDLNKTRVPISIAKFIKLKLGDVFTFLIAHNHRHMVQAEKALEALSIKPTQKITGATHNIKLS